MKLKVNKQKKERKQKGNRKKTERKQKEKRKKKGKKEKEDKPGDNPIFKAASFGSPIQAQEAPQTFKAYCPIFLSSSNSVSLISIGSWLRLFCLSTYSWVFFSNNNNIGLVWFSVTNFDYN